MDETELNLVELYAMGESVLELIHDGDGDGIARLVSETNPIITKGQKNQVRIHTSSHMSEPGQLADALSGFVRGVLGPKPGQRVDVFQDEDGVSISLPDSQLNLAEIVDDHIFSDHIGTRTLGAYERGSLFADGSTLEFVRNGMKDQGMYDLKLSFGNDSELPVTFDLRGPRIAAGRELEERFTQLAKEYEVILNGNRLEYEVSENGFSTSARVDGRRVDLVFNVGNDMRLESPRGVQTVESPVPHVQVDVRVPTDIATQVTTRSGNFNPNNADGIMKAIHSGIGEWWNVLNREFAKNPDPALIPILSTYRPTFGKKISELIEKSGEIYQSMLERASEFNRKAMPVIKTKGEKAIDYVRDRVDQVEDMALRGVLRAQYGMYAANSFAHDRISKGVEAVVSGKLENYVRDRVDQVEDMALRGVLRAQYGMYAANSFAYDRISNGVEVVVLAKLGDKLFDRSLKARVLYDNFMREPVKNPELLKKTVLTSAIVLGMMTMAPAVENANFAVNDGIRGPVVEFNYLGEHSIEMSLPKLHSGAVDLRETVFENDREAVVNVYPGYRIEGSWFRDPSDPIAVELKRPAFENIVWPHVYRRGDGDTLEVVLEHFGEKKTIPIFLPYDQKPAYAIKIDDGEAVVSVLGLGERGKESYHVPQIRTEKIIDGLKVSINYRGNYSEGVVSIDDIFRFLPISPNVGVREMPKVYVVDGNESCLDLKIEYLERTLNFNVLTCYEPMPIYTLQGTDEGLELRVDYEGVNRNFVLLSRKSDSFIDADRVPGGFELTLGPKGKQVSHVYSWNDLVPGLYIPDIEETVEQAAGIVMSTLGRVYLYRGTDGLNLLIDAGLTPIEFYVPLPGWLTSKPGELSVGRSLVSQDKFGIFGEYELGINWSLGGKYIVTGEYSPENSNPILLLEQTGDFGKNGRIEQWEPEEYFEGVPETKEIDWIVSSEMEMRSSDRYLRIPVVSSNFQIVPESVMVYDGRGRDVEFELVHDQLGNVYAKIEKSRGKYTLQFDMARVEWEKMDIEVYEYPDDIRELYPEFFGTPEDFEYPDNLDDLLESIEGLSIVEKAEIIRTYVATNYEYDSGPKANYSINKSEGNNMAAKLDESGMGKCDQGNLAAATLARASGLAAYVDVIQQGDDGEYIMGETNHARMHVLVPAEDGSWYWRTFDATPYDKLDGFSPMLTIDGGLDIEQTHVEWTDELEKFDEMLSGQIAQSEYMIDTTGSDNNQMCVEEENSKYNPSLTKPITGTIETCVEITDTDSLTDTVQAAEVITETEQSRMIFGTSDFKVVDGTGAHYGIDGRSYSVPDNLDLEQRVNVYEIEESGIARAVVSGESGMSVVQYMCEGQMTIDMDGDIFVLPPTYGPDAVKIVDGMPVTGTVKAGIEITGTESLTDMIKVGEGYTVAGSITDTVTGNVMDTAAGEAVDQELSKSSDIISSSDTVDEMVYKVFEIESSMFVFRDKNNNSSVFDEISHRPRILEVAGADIDQNEKFNIIGKGSTENHSRVVISGTSGLRWFDYKSPVTTSLQIEGVQYDLPPSYVPELEVVPEKLSIVADEQRYNVSGVYLEEIKTLVGDYAYRSIEGIHVNPGITLELGIEDIVEGEKLNIIGEGYTEGYLRAVISGTQGLRWFDYQSPVTTSVQIDGIEYELPASYTPEPEPILTDVPVTTNAEEEKNFLTEETVNALIADSTEAAVEISEPTLIPAESVEYDARSSDQVTDTVSIDIDAGLDEMSMSGPVIEIGGGDIRELYDASSTNITETVKEVEQGMNSQDAVLQNNPTPVSDVSDGSIDDVIELPVISMRKTYVADLGLKEDAERDIRFFDEYKNLLYALGGVAAGAAAGYFGRKKIATIVESAVQSLQPFDMKKVFVGYQMGESGDVLEEKLSLYQILSRAEFHEIELYDPDVVSKEGVLYLDHNALNVALAYIKHNNGQDQVKISDTKVYIDQGMDTTYEVNIVNRVADGLVDVNVVRDAVLDNYIAGACAKLTGIESVRIDVNGEFGAEYVRDGLDICLPGNIYKELSDVGQQAPTEIVISLVPVLAGNDPRRAMEMYKQIMDEPEMFAMI